MTSAGGIRTWAAREWPAEWTVRHVVETGSTNDDLITAVEAGEAVDRTVLVTDHQTAGRGRLDRRWDAPPGENLLASILFRAVPEHPARLTQGVGVAIVQALERLAGRTLAPRLGLKWPNDVMLDGHKLAGILAQRSVASGAVVVGFGLNVGWGPDGSATIARDLADIAPDATVPDVLVAVLIELDRIDVTDDAAVSAAYLARLLTLGETVRAHLPGDRELVGEATAVDAAGRLVILDENGDTHVLDAGDVVHLRRV